MRTRLGLKVLGLSALVMGVMAIGTTGGAQATVGACWGYINASSELKCFSAELEAELAVKIEGAGAVLLTPTTLEVRCTGAAFVAGGTLSANGSILLGRVEFSGCTSLKKTDLGALAACTPKDPVTGSGRIRTEEGNGLIVLHNGEPTVLLKAHTLTLAKIFLGEECSVAEELIVGGELVLEDAGGATSFKEHKVTHLIREHATLHLMHIGANGVLIHGTAEVSLAGKHSGLKWAGLPA